MFSVPRNRKLNKLQTAHHEPKNTTDPKNSTARPLKNDGWKTMNFPFGMRPYFFRGQRLFNFRGWSILIGFSIINHPFWGYPYFRKHPYIRIWQSDNIYEKADDISIVQGFLVPDSETEEPPFFRMGNQVMTGG